jgi:transposase InsO family protein
LILGLIHEAVESGARLEEACKILGIHPRTIQRWKAQGIGEDRRAGPRTTPANKLKKEERRKILYYMGIPKFRDLSPRQIVPLLAERGTYIGSEATIYRILKEEGQLTHRSSSEPPKRVGRPKHLVATGPCQVWTWDITYLPTDVKGLFYYLYQIVDIWSRKIVGWSIKQEENGEWASHLVREACLRERVDPNSLDLHMDRGSPMKSATFLATLQKLGVVPSFSRPKVSNDNPYSESLFRTLKYCPSYPRGGFESLEEAKKWVSQFVVWYNTEHRHSMIRFVTPEQRHNGTDKEILEARKETYRKARRENPNRWSGPIRDWNWVEVVHLNPPPKKELEVGVA